MFAGHLKVLQRFHSHFQNAVEKYKEMNLFLGEDQAVIQALIARSKEEVAKTIEAAGRGNVDEGEDAPAPATSDRF
jgi:GTPase